MNLTSSEYDQAHSEAREETLHQEASKPESHIGTVPSWLVLEQIVKRGLHHEVLLLTHSNGSGLGIPGIILLYPSLDMLELIRDSKAGLLALSGDWTLGLLEAIYQSIETLEDNPTSSSDQTHLDTPSSSAKVS